MPKSLDSQDHPHFILRTCQRTLLLSAVALAEGQDWPDRWEEANGEEAYVYLLETICGLKSKLIGENEIVGQFKDAYKEYLAGTARDGNLIRILEKLFKDAKEVRTNYLIGLSQKTYASLTRKNIMRGGADKVLILGSGNLAEDLINQFKKKLPVAICARNTERVRELSSKHSFEVVPWGDLKEILSYSHVVNTIGSEQILFDQSFFSDWATMHSKRVFVDLGSPSPLHSTLNREDGLIRLDDIFNEGAVHEEYKLEQIEKARAAMRLLGQRRKELLAKRLEVIATLPEANL